MDSLTLIFQNKDHTKYYKENSVTCTSEFHPTACNKTFDSIFCQIDLITTGKLGMQMSTTSIKIVTSANDDAPYIHNGLQVATQLKILIE